MKCVTDTLHANELIRSMDMRITSKKDEFHTILIKADVSTSDLSQGWENQSELSFGCFSPIGKQTLLGFLLYLLS